MEILLKLLSLSFVVRRVYSLYNLRLCGDENGVPFPCDSVGGISSSSSGPRVRQVTLGASAQLQLVQPSGDISYRHDSGASSPAREKETSPSSIDTKEALFANAQLISKKPIGDHRLYQHARLANGLEVVSINDESTKSAAFALALDAGLYYDPPEHYGLAHLTEHSLFLGTSKFPERSGFDEFLSKHGGSSNAYTAEEVTVYYGNLDGVGFREGLDRFGDMFRAPLLNESAIWQEVSAVVSEHAKNIQDPGWYSERVMLSVADPKNPIQHFHTGDASTLKNLGATNISKEIQSYFNSNYCPPRMHLVTFSTESLQDQLLAVNATFGDIPRTGLHRVCTNVKKGFQSPEPFSEDRLRKWLVVEGTQNTATLWMHFPLWDLAPWRKSHPMNYAEYMLGWGGKDSLNLLLRDQLGLADGVSLQSEDSSAGTMVWITAGLTSKGLKNPQAVLDVIFTFLNHAKKGCTVETITSLANSAKLMWDWPSPMDAARAASTLAEGMTRVDAQDLLTADDLTEQPNRTRVLEILSKLTPERMNVGLVMPNAAQLGDNGSKSFMTLEHYGVRYNVSTLEHWAPDWKKWGAIDASDDQNVTQIYTALAQRLRASNISFQGSIALVLPGPIHGIPENFPLDYAKADRGSETMSQVWGTSPKSLLRNSTAELWFRKGWVNPQPWIEASLTLRAHKSDSRLTSPRDVVVLQVGMHLLAEEMNLRLADVGYKGFYFSVSETHRGVYIWLSGFSPNLLNVTEDMLREMNSALDTVDNASLARNIAALKADFSDATREPIKMAMTDQKVLLTSRMHSRAEMLDAISKGPEISFADAKQAVESARRGQFYATSVVLGNYADEDAKVLHNKLLNGLGAQPTITSDNVERVAPVVMPNVPIEIRKANPREGDQNHVTIVTLLLGTATVENRVLLGLVGQIYSQVVFAELRTRKELGYVVGGDVSEMSSILTIDCYVQGEKMLPDDVEDECEHVWAVTVPQQLAALDESAFNAHKESFKSSLMEGPLSPNQELNHFEDPILLGGCLGLRSSMLAFLETVTSGEQLLAAWKDAVMPYSGNHVETRKKVAVKYFGAGTEIPSSPSLNKSSDLMRTASLDSSILERLKKERELMRILPDANSTLRESLVSEGGYFPTELHCSWSQADASENAHHSTVKVAPQKNTSRVVVQVSAGKSLMRIHGVGTDQRRKGNLKITRQASAASRSHRPSTKRKQMHRPLLQPRASIQRASFEAGKAHMQYRFPQHRPSLTSRPDWVRRMLGLKFES